MTKRAFIFTGQGEKLGVRSPQLTTFWTSVALAKTLIANGIVPDVVGGLSLGEFAGLAIANVFSLEELERILCFRQEIMDRSLRGSDTGMIVCIGALVEKIGNDAEECGLAVTNYNSPTQIVLGGKRNDIEEFRRMIPKVPDVMVVDLSTPGAFHSKYLRKASGEMKEFLKDFGAEAPTVPIYYNLTGSKDVGDIKEAIAKHLSHPVQFQRLIEDMLRDEVNEFLSIGIGTAPVGLIRSICKYNGVQAKVSKVESLDDVERLCV